MLNDIVFPTAVIVALFVAMTLEIFRYRRDNLESDQRKKIRELSSKIERMRLLLKINGIEDTT